MQDLAVKANPHDFSATHAAMRRWVDGNILAGVSSAVLVGRDIVDLHCEGWADKEAQVALRPDHLFGRRMEMLVLAVLGQLRATNPWHAITREWSYGDPPATVLGRAEAAFFARDRR